MLAKLKADGKLEVRQEGSHRQFRHPVKPGRVTVTVHGLSQHIKPKTLNAILKQAGWK